MACHEKIFPVLMFIMLTTLLRIGGFKFSSSQLGLLHIGRGLYKSEIGRHASTSSQINGVTAELQRRISPTDNSMEVGLS